MAIKKILAFCIILAGAVLVHSFCSAAPLMIDKNLFAQDRKPPSPESAVSSSQPAKPGMPINNIQLDGVIVQGNNRKALIRLKSQATGADKKKPSPFITVRENQQVGDFRVLKIEHKSVSLEKDGQTFVISLFAEGKVVTPAAVQPAPSAPAAVTQVPIPKGHRVQPGQMIPGQAIPPNGGDPGIMDPALMQPPPLPGQIAGQVPEPIPPEQDLPVTDQAILPEEELQQ